DARPFLALGPLSVKGRAILTECQVEPILAAPCVGQCTGGTVWRGMYGCDCPNVIESDATQHIVYCWDVRAPPIRRIIVQLAMRIESHDRPSESHHVDDSFQNQ